MRHIGTLIAAIIIAPLAWVLIAFGQDRSAQAFANAHDNGSFHTGDFLRPLLFLAAAGILLGLIATLRMSPLGAVLTGALYAASYVLLLFAPQGVLDLFPGNLSVAGRHADLTTPIRTGTTLLVGAALLVAVVSTGRWRRWPERVEAAPDTTSTDLLAPLPDRNRPFDTGGFGLGTGSGDRDTGLDSYSRYGTTDRTPPGGSDSHWVASLRGNPDDTR